MAHDDLVSPVDLDEGGARGLPGLGWATGAIALATVFLALTNAVSIRDWADELTPSPWQAELSAAADGWVAFTDATGLGAPRAGLHALWKKAQGARFGGGAGVEQE